MSWVDRFAETIMAYSRPVIAVMLVLTVVAGAGAGTIEQSSDLGQFQSDTTESEKLEYVEANFSTGPNNTTVAQVIVRGDNVLTRDSQLETLRLQQSFRENETIDRTLVDDRPTIGVANLLAIASITGEQQRELAATAAEFEAVNATVREERGALEERRAELNATQRELRAALDTLHEEPSASPRAQFDAVAANSSVELDDTQYATFNESAQLRRNAENESQIAAASRLGTQGVLADEYQDLERRSEDLESQADRLEELGGQLAEQQAALENATSPTLQEQIDAVESMNATEYERALDTVLGEESAGQLSGLAFMPTNYEAGSTSSNATMLMVTHQSEGGGGRGGTASDAVVDAQLAMQSIANEDVAGDGSSVIVFGGGVMSQEIENSMGDSLAIVGPLALLFVVVALLVAYRDLLDILLGLFGIVAVLVWTFGFMGWAGIDFNQMFIAVPVLLIGLSIDYAIHIFMRHREQRQHGGAYGDDDARGSMRVALAGVGIALVLVTATTAIGFLSNLTSPVPPIQDFGIVSAVGITAALLVFGTLVPALKVELDERLENRGFDRRKRAFGTGGGRFSQLLSTGSTAARRVPIVVILVAALVSAGGAYGATQVDTSFDQEDFIAEDPPEWTSTLPGPLEPSDYSMKENLAFVNRNFVREDSQAQILVEGTVTDPETVRRLSEAEREAADSDVAVPLSSDEADVQSPLRTMQRVAAENESFNATLTAADTDGDGVPDRNVEQVYDELFAVAPDEAAGVIHRTQDGDYEAVRMVVSTSGAAAMSDVTTEMQAIADGLDGNGLEATATGQTILFDIVQEQLMDTVIESLLITLVAVFVFLMVAYRLTKGSATLGAVTLLPVVFSVSWILGTMALLEIPFNVMTGMITSLTVGLGVAYSIHMSERYSLELERTGSVWEAMSRTVTGTGGALLGSAATTVGGFGVLVVAILPPLQQFGIITGMTIIYAFLASVLVLPSLLVVWTKYLGPDVSFDAPSDSSAVATASDGGQVTAASNDQDGT
ncbi:MMPL family transporter [Natrinema salaciae]|uniref:Hydrophobe/amphiphile efflux-3 (HAE3) family protein n=1 Tax=Natrinema salaciae TaxID=1186196 RepID=A0A1H9NI68_9EURY|nr:MMPL family transporter [Natrinema salaciae]SER35359.1 hydrophobe/amphiphile efflux-3 (HAE3) family protein [Natrinema salaciae]